MINLINLNCFFVLQLKELFGPSSIPSPSSSTDKDTDDQTRTSEFPEESVDRAKSALDEVLAKHVQEAERRDYLHSKVTEMDQETNGNAMISSTSHLIKTHKNLN